jgi:hypothetical protein
LFVPGRLDLGWRRGRAAGCQRAFATYVNDQRDRGSLPPSASRWDKTAAERAAGLCAGESNSTAALRTRCRASHPRPSFKQSVLIHYVWGGEETYGVATQLTARLSDLPAPALLHFEEYLSGGFDKEYPDHLPRTHPSFGTVAQFTNFLAQARARNQLTMPYTNPTFWGVDPKGPTFLATNDAPLLVNLDGSYNYEEYFGEGGMTVTPWHPAVQAANRNTRNQFLTNYPVDVLFQDQVGARTWQYDINPAAPTPYAYIGGVAAIAAGKTAS